MCTKVERTAEGPPLVIRKLHVDGALATLALLVSFLLLLKSFKASPDLLYFNCTLKYVFKKQK